MYIVYKHTSPSGKCYIGITKQGMDRRARQGRGYIRCTAFYNAIMKYGWDNFKHEVLEVVDTYEQACEREKYYIETFNSINRKFGYNLTSGGGFDFAMSDETKKRVSKATKGRSHPLSEETKRKLSEIRKGVKMPPRSAETCRKLSEALKGRTFTDEHKRNISIAKVGTQAGENNPRARKVLCVETGVIFKTIKDDGEFTGGSSKNIIAACNGRLQTSGGYHWQYANEVSEI